MYLSSLTLYLQIHKYMGDMLNKWIDGAKADWGANNLDDGVKIQKRSGKARLMDRN